MQEAPRAATGETAMLLLGLAWLALSGHLLATAGQLMLLLN